MYKYLAASVAAVFIAGSAQAAVFDFETGFSGGDTPASVTAGGVTATVSTGDAGHPAMIYDTGVLTGGDTDLVADFALVGTSVFDYDPGNIMIISEDGDSSDPDDDRNGGVLMFTFLGTLVDLTSVDIFDAESGGNEIDIWVNGLEVITGLVTGNHKYDTVDLSAFTGVNSVWFEFGGSGAIDNLAFEAPAPVPVPAALPLLMAGLGSLGFVARRRKSA